MFPQLVANEKAQKGQAFWKILKVFYNPPLTYTREFRGLLHNQKAYSLQIVYEFSSTISADLVQVCTTIQGNDLRIVHGYFSRWMRHLMTCSQKKFALFLYLSKGIFKGCFASFAKDFNIRRYHLLTPLRKTSHYICRFERGILHTNRNHSYTYKGNSKGISVGWYCKYPSLNSHENGILAGCFFKNSKYVYNHLSTYVKAGFWEKVDGLMAKFFLFFHK